MIPQVGNYVAQTCLTSNDGFQGKISRRVGEMLESRSYSLTATKRCYIRG